MVNGLYLNVKEHEILIWIHIRNRTNTKRQASTTEFLVTTPMVVVCSDRLPIGYVSLPCTNRFVAEGFIMVLATG